MSDFFADLAGIALNARTVVRPRLGSWFEPSRPGADMLLEQHVETEARPAPPKAAPNAPAPSDTVPVPAAVPALPQPEPIVDGTTTRVERVVVPPSVPAAPTAPVPPPPVAARPPIPPAIPARDDPRVVTRTAQEAQRVPVPTPAPIAPSGSGRPHDAATVIPSAPALSRSMARGQPRDTAPEANRRRRAPAAPPPVEPRLSSDHTVEITIGRVDVRAIMPPAAPAIPPTRRTPELSLEDYLKQRSGGQP